MPPEASASAAAHPSRLRSPRPAPAAPATHQHKSGRATLAIDGDQPPGHLILDQLDVRVDHESDEFWKATTKETVPLTRRSTGDARLTSCSSAHRSRRGRASPVRCIQTPCRKTQKWCVIVARTKSSAPREPLQHPPQRTRERVGAATRPTHGSHPDSSANSPAVTAQDPTNGPLVRARVASRPRCKLVAARVQTVLRWVLHGSATVIRCVPPRTLVVVSGFVTLDEAPFRDSCVNLPALNRWRCGGEPVLACPACTGLGSRPAGPRCASPETRIHPMRPEPPVPNLIGWARKQHVASTAASLRNARHCHETSCQWPSCQRLSITGLLLSDSGPVCTLLSGASASSGAISRSAGSRHVNAAARSAGQDAPMLGQIQHCHK